MTREPHDHLVRAIFGNAAHAAAELAGVLPGPLLAEIDLATLVAVPGTFVDETLRDHEADLLFTVRRRDGAGSALVYLLLEHQSRSDRWMALRLLTYQARIWERWQRDHPDASKLPEIVVAVLYHGEERWSGGASFGERVERLGRFVAPAAGAGGPFGLDFGFVVDDLALASDDAIRRRTADAVTTLTLLALKHARVAADLASRLRSWISLLDEVAGAPGGRAALLVVLRYLALVSRELTPVFLREVLAMEASEKVQSTAKTLAELLRDEGREAGREEGREEGRREMRDTLRRLLVRRFGPTDAFVEARLATASSAQLDAWMMRLFDATSADDVVAD